MIVWDTETTGLTKPAGVPLEQQPEIIEFGAVKLDDATLDVVDELQFLVRPTLMWPLVEQVTKWTGITTEMLEPAKTFPLNLRKIADFTLGERTWVAHNIAHDVGCLAVELQRIGMLTRFPWPPEPVCTVELTMDLEVARLRSDRLKQEDLYLHLTGMKPPVVHRAVEDARALCEIVRKLRALDGRI